MDKTSKLKVSVPVALVLLTIGSCHRLKAPVSAPILNVSLCDLYKNPAKYEGKRIAVSATLTRLPGGKYLYPNPTNLCEEGLSFIKPDGGAIDNGELLEPWAASSVRKEVDVAITGIFDSKYAEDDEAFRLRIVPSEIKRQSPV